MHDPPTLGPAAETVLIGPEDVDPIVGVSSEDGDGMDVGERQRAIAVHLDVEVGEQVLSGPHSGVGILRGHDQVTGSPP